MKIKIWFFGKKSEISDFEKEMLRRIGFRAEVNIFPISQSGISNPLAAKRAEADVFLNKIPDHDFLVVLDERGHQLDSVGFSRELKRWIVDRGEIHFVIGGAHGLDQKIISRANYLLSFGGMVWTRNLFRKMVCEQIYRALEIDGGSNFHKE
ncbi:23S rRNA (pseudouridine(1915)-N(3))-methyltransferase RlmH [bacterium]|jgi:23S rRNA (pseudouridine1915-N3)-methyltransferase|nr:23S rRNA (pseudouridine(1915)-N(3))-methyltransferase RlmH [bacterium]MBT6832121.1 23S rRNA (pseudouridine(1915)-N(3))-methyltransferase RlmH [bacterium]MBT6996695.1 23S rRNA (pseudouridine(1915)-N(3))-methyltransferase RlmH [bacterium]MBT7772335.1 23S rRNA (pseudouridine(1915)-N(3))-methyltransferase RlmH [bacterium]